ncbi:glycerophosphodiester phosphodiesterase [soil metagenome]
MNKLLLSFSLATMCAPLSQATEIIAHRGFSARAPENTLAAFRLAWENKTDACELDLYLTADGQIAIIHDKDTKRVSGVDKQVATSTMAELQTLDVGSLKGAAWAGEKIPTLEQALATMPIDSKRFFLEIKCGAEVVPALKKVLEPMKERAAQLAVIGFDREATLETKKAMPWLKVYRLASGKNKDKTPRTDLSEFLAQVKADGLDGVDMGTDWSWNEAMVKQVHDAGLSLYVWTVNDAAKAREFAALGVDGVTTDDPVMVREALVKP